MSSQPVAYFPCAKMQILFEQISYFTIKIPKQLSALELDKIQQEESELLIARLKLSNSLECEP